MSDFNEMYKALRFRKNKFKDWPHLDHVLEDEDRRPGIERRRLRYFNHIADKRSGIGRRRKGRLGS